MLRSKARLLAQKPIPTPICFIKGSIGIVKGNGNLSNTKPTTAAITDFEGLVRITRINEVRYNGGRRVENLASATSILSGASMTLTLPAGTYNISMGTTSGGTITFSGTGGATGTLVGNTSNRVALTKTITAGTLILTASVTDLIQIQVTDVSGMGNQIASEYVAMDTIYNAGVIGVRYFDTINANTMSSYSVIESVGTLITPTPYLLMEKTYTQFIASPNTFTAADWTATNASITANTAVSPNGRSEASTLTFTTTGGVLTNTFTVPFTASLTFSVYIKVASGTFNLKIAKQSGTTGFLSVTATTTWQKYSFAAPITLNEVVVLTIGADTSSAYTLPAVGSIQIWGANAKGSGETQLEFNPNNVSIIQEQITFPSSNINTTKGMMVMYFLTANQGTVGNRYFTLTGSSFRFGVETANNWKVTDGINSLEQSVTFTNSPNCIVLIAWDSVLLKTMVAISIDNGVSYISGTLNYTGSLGTVTAIELGKSLSVTFQLKGLKIYDTLPDNLYKLPAWIAAKNPTTFFAG